MSWNRLLGQLTVMQPTEAQDEVYFQYCPQEFALVTQQTESEKERMPALNQLSRPDPWTCMTCDWDHVCMDGMFCVSVKIF